MSKNTTDDQESEELTKRPTVEEVEPLITTDMTYEEIAGKINAARDEDAPQVSAYTVGVVARNEGLVDDRRKGAKYDEDDPIPVVQSASGHIEHRIPESICKEYGISEERYIRYIPIVAGVDEFGFDLYVGDDVTGQQRNDRKPRRAETRHVYALYPKVTAIMANLHTVAEDVSESAESEEVGGVLGAIEAGGDEDSNEPECTATFERQGENTLRVTFEPGPRPWTAPESIEGTAGDELSSIVKPLQRVPVSKKEKLERGYDEDDELVSKWRLEFPRDYIDTYGLTASDREVEGHGVTREQLEQGIDGDEVAFRFGIQDGEVVMVLDFDGVGAHSSVTRRVQKYEAGYETDDADYTVDQLFVYPPKSGLHAVGIATTSADSERSIELTPKSRYALLRRHRAE